MAEPLHVKPKIIEKIEKVELVQEEEKLVEGRTPLKRQKREKKAVKPITAEEREERMKRLLEAKKRNDR